MKILKENSNKTQKNCEWPLLTTKLSVDALDVDV